MSERIVQPGPVTPAAFDSIGGVIPATVVGTNPVWSDDSDATYVEFTNYTDSGTATYFASVAFATLPPITVSETATVTVRIRGRGLVPVGSGVGVTIGLGDPGAITQWLFSFTDSVPPGPGVESPSSIYNTTDWFTAILNDATPLKPGTRADFAAGAEFGVFWESVAPPLFPVVTHTARIYELQFVIVDNSGNPLRRYPPVNNGGSGPTRHYPRSPGRRGTY